MIKSHGDYYIKNKISPVRQDLSDLEKHFTRRSSLYRQLGILPDFISKKRVLEVGPGSGHNALYTSSLLPQDLVLVEPNPSGIKGVKTLFKEHPKFAQPEIIPLKLEEYQCAEKFNFVFCEGVLGQIPNPKPFLKLLGETVLSGGILVLTTVDYISVLSDMLRRLLAHMLIDPKSSLDEQVQVLLPVFRPHLDNLKGMSRLHDDWIIDNLLVPGSAANFISFPEAIEILSDKFDIFSSSPKFLSDWRWYKEITNIGDNFSYNKRATNQYWQYCHNFLDHQDYYGPRSEKQNKSLLACCKKLTTLINRYETQRSEETILEICGFLSQISTEVLDFSEQVAQCIAKFEKALRTTKPELSEIFADTKFTQLFGRAQQYLSLTRRSA